MRARKLFDLAVPDRSLPIQSTRRASGASRAPSGNPLDLQHFSVPGRAPAAARCGTRPRGRAFRSASNECFFF